MSFTIQGINLSGSGHSSPATDPFSVTRLIVTSNVLETSQAAHNAPERVPANSLASYTSPQTQPTPNSLGYFCVRIASDSVQCDRLCDCQCHLSTRISSPRWLQSVFGMLFYSYAGSPKLNLRPCNLPLCSRTAFRSAQFTYYFPTWILPRLLSFTSTWRDLTGFGASWTIRMPRVIPFEKPIWRLMRYGSVDEVRTLFNKQEASALTLISMGYLFCTYVSLVHLFLS
jgi:hypothetical protein